MAVFLERMRRRREDLALISLLVFGLVEMVQSPWAIPGMSLMGAWSDKQLWLDRRLVTASLCRPLPQDAGYNSDGGIKATP